MGIGPSCMSSGKESLSIFLSFSLNPNLITSYNALATSTSPHIAAMSSSLLWKRANLPSFSSKIAIGLMLLHKRSRITIIFLTSLLLNIFVETSVEVRKLLRFLCILTLLLFGCAPESSLELETDSGETSKSVDETFVVNVSLVEADELGVRWYEDDDEIDDCLGETTCKFTESSEESFEVRVTYTSQDARDNGASSDTSELGLESTFGNLFSFISSVGQDIELKDTLTLIWSTTTTTTTIPTTTNSILGTWSDGDVCPLTITLNSDDTFSETEKDSVTSGTYTFEETVTAGSRHTFVTTTTSDNLGNNCNGVNDNDAGTVFTLYLEFPSSTTFTPYFEASGGVSLGATFTKQ